MKDNVNHPFHYERWKEIIGVEPIEIAEHLNFNLGNVIKYVMRAGFKEGSSVEEDLRKAQFYLTREVENIRSKSKLESSYFITNTYSEDFSDRVFENSSSD